MDSNTIGTIGLTIWLGWVSIPIALMLFSSLISFWTRGRLDLRLAGRYQQFKWRWCETNMVEADHYFAYVFGDILAVGFLIFILCCLYFNFGIMGFIILASLAGVIILPRYIGDIFHTLKYCFKSKESLRLKELEAKVEELSKK